MNLPDFSTLVARHRAYFQTGATRSVEWREGQLTALRAMMTDRAGDFHAALWTDLRRNRTDADLTDVKFLADEADHACIEQAIDFVNARPSPLGLYIFAEDQQAAERILTSTCSG